MSFRPDEGERPNSQNAPAYGVGRNGWPSSPSSTATSNESISQQDVVFPGAIAAFIFATLIFIGAIIVILRTSSSLSRMVWHRKFHPTLDIEKSDQSHMKGGASRLRKTLVICLLVSDVLISFSSIWPAIVKLSRHHLNGSKCEIPGFILASALWWQYGFSLTIAITTYVALRHPLSVFKDFAERASTPIIALIIVIGMVQAVLWRALEGFGRWRDTCFYGPPSIRAAEMLQFLPRLLTSLLIIVIYIPLIHFLRRPDMTSIHFSPRLQSTSPKRPRSETSGSQGTLTMEDQEEIPPWERLSFPNMNLLAEPNEEKHTAPQVQETVDISSPIQSNTSKSRAPTPLKRMSLALGSISGLSHSKLSANARESATSRGRVRPSTAPEAPTPAPQLKLPSLSVGSPLLPLSRIIADQSSTRSPSPSPTINVFDNPVLEISFERQIDYPSPRSRSPESFRCVHHGHEDDKKCLACVEKRRSGKASHYTHVQHKERVPKCVEDSRKRHVQPSLSPIRPVSPIHTSRLLYAPSSAHMNGPSVTITTVSSDTLISSPVSRNPSRQTSNRLRIIPPRPDMKIQPSLTGNSDCASFRGMLTLSSTITADKGGMTGDEMDGVTEGGKIESMAKFMNRSTSSFLLWFPLTHLVVCALTIARFAGYALTRIDGPALEALTLITILGQSAADVIIFGFVERRTRHKFRQQQAKYAAGAMTGQKATKGPR